MEHAARYVPIYAIVDDAALPWGRMGRIGQQPTSKLQRAQVTQEGGTQGGALTKERPNVRAGELLRQLQARQQQLETPGGDLPECYVIVHDPKLSIPSYFRTFRIVS